MIKIHLHQEPCLLLTPKYNNVVIEIYTKEKRKCHKPNRNKLGLLINHSNLQHIRVQPLHLHIRLKTSMLQMTASQSGLLASLINPYSAFSSFLNLKGRLELFAYVPEYFLPLYHYTRNFCNLIGLEQWYFS